MTSLVDRLLGLAFIAGGASLGFYGWSLQAENLMGDVGPGFFPGLIGLLMAGLGAFLAVLPPGDAQPPISGRRLGLLVAFVAAAIAYAGLFTRFGFSLPTFAFLVVAMTILGRRTPLSLARYAVGSAVFTLVLGWLLFGVLGIPLSQVWLYN